jgi:release factor glutamine methyltransferase
VACDFAAALRGGFDLVVCNPPYVRTADIAALAAEVREHDPGGALDGGPDGLSAYAALARDAAGLLAPRGQLVVELGIGMATEVAALFSAAGLKPLEARLDLAGIARALPICRTECV